MDNYVCECPQKDCNRPFPTINEDGKDEWYEIQHRNGLFSGEYNHWVIAKTCDWDYIASGYKLVEEGKVCNLVAKVNEKVVD